MKLYRRILPLLVILSMGGCSTKPVVWEKITSGNVDVIYTQQNVDFSRYTRLYVEPFEIHYPQDARRPDPEDLARIRQIFRETFRAALGGEYEIVTKKANNVLAIRASLLDLRSNEPVGAVSLGKLADFAHPGHMTFLMEFIDGSSDEVLARAADEEKTDLTTEYVGDAANWDAVKVSAQRWAELFRSFLDNNLGKTS